MKQNISIRNKSDKLIIADKELAFQKGEKEKLAAELGLAIIEIAFQENEKEKRAEELIIANKELAFQNKIREKRAEELVIANKELAFQNDEKEKRAAELIIANKELAFQNEEKEKRAAELVIANKELTFQNEEKEKRAAELIIANIELAYQNDEKDKRASELSANVKQLKESEVLFRLIVENVKEYSIIMLDANGNIKTWNKGSERIKGYSANEIIGKHISIVYTYDENQKKEPERNLKMAKENGYYKTEGWRIRKDGALFFANVVFTALYDEKGILHGYSKITHDITERRKAEAEIKRNSEKLSHINKELTFQNEEKEKRAKNLIILSEDLKVQKDGLGKANDELHEKAQLLQRQEENLFRLNDELFCLNKDLEKRVFERTSELEILNHDLKDLSVSKDKFLSVISHDLRNPLTALLLATDELNKHTGNNAFDPIQPFIKIIHRASHSILKQLNELVDWAKMQQNKTNLNPEKIHLVSAVDHSFELLKSNATQKNISFENKVPLDIYVKANALMLRSILQNLVTNSIKYSLPGGLILVTAQHLDKFAEICVIDSGIGMEADTKDNLFTKVNSASVSGTNNEKGSGLGLILVKDFITWHGGTIRVESEMRKGTCIIFTVPEY